MRLFRHLAFLLLFPASLLHAQHDSLHILDPVTITSGYAPIPVSQSGRNVITVKGEWLQRLPVHTVDDLLRYVPGVEVQQRGPMGAQSDIVMRGGTFQQVLIILDGLRLNDPITGHFNAYIPINTAEIDRVEILKGAASAIYGTEAVGGVIQIVSKAFAAKSSSQGQANLALGEYGLSKLNAGGLLQVGKTFLSGGLSQIKTKGQQQRGTRGFLDNRQFSASAYRNFGNHWRAGVRTARDIRDFSAQNFYTAFAADTATEKVSGWLHQAHASYENGTLKWRNEFSYKTTRDNYLFNSGLTPNDNSAKQIQALSVAHFSPASLLNMVTGVQFLHKEIISNDRGNHRVQDLGMFALFTWFPVEGFRMETALRVDNHSIAGWQFLPQLSLSYRNKKYQIRASSGRTLRDADFTERYNNYNKSGLRTGSIGNPNLVHEQSWSSEAGMDWFSKNWRISSTFFHRHHSQLIDFVTTGFAQMPRKDNLVPGGIYALAMNLGEVRSFGWEADIFWQNKFSSDGMLQTSLGATWINTSTPGGEPGFYLSSHARWLINGNLLATWKKFDFTLSGIYKKRQPREAAAPLVPVQSQYLVMNARLAYLVFPSIQLYIQCDNMANRQYSDFSGAKMPGRWMLTGINVNF